MPKVTVSLRHSLAANSALDRAKELLRSLRSEAGSNISNYSESWSTNSASFSFTAIGMNFAGQVLLTSSDVTVICQLPMVAIGVKGRIEELIRAKMVSIYGYK